MKNQEKTTLSIETRVYPVASRNNLLAFASVTLGGCFAVNGIQIMNSKNGVFVAMPSVKDKRGEYRDICFPITGEFRSALHEAVMSEYARATMQTAAAQ
ncbi:MAG: SpoVG family protein [Gracilibacteraceae bacterium]|jgi:stage V sporulation protein G|nr:SpoVG family protein [Gracilibacteraceae bacterium]